jgi:hypothetical protein
MANPNPRDVKAVAKAVAEPGVAGALLGLVEQGCDRDELLRLLARLRHAVVASRRATKKLKRLAGTLQRASSGMGDLPHWRESGNLGLPGDAATWLRDCSHDLELLGAAILSRLDCNDTPEDNSRVERAKNPIVQYVIGQTGAPQDIEVAALIGAVLGSGKYGVAAHIKWRTGLAQAS